jgi:hypothetical protein
MKGVRIIIDDGENYDNDMPPAFIPRFSVFYRRGGDLARVFSEKSAWFRSAASRREFCRFVASSMVGPIALSKALQ